MSAIVNGSHLVIGLFALWFLYFFCWHEHRIDAYRQRLFGVRDDLVERLVERADSLRSQTNVHSSLGACATRGPSAHQPHGGLDGGC